MSEELKHRCEKLSLEDKVELREYLSTLIASDQGQVRKSPLRCSILLGEVAKVMGVVSIGYFSRDTDQVWARTMVAYQMIKEGYSTTEIGHQMMKEHSTIIHMRKKMEDVFYLPHAYRDILEIWNKFQTQIQS